MLPYHGDIYHNVTEVFSSVRRGLATRMSKLSRFTLPRIVAIGPNR